MVFENPNLLDFERELFTKPGRGASRSSVEEC